MTLGLTTWQWIVLATMLAGSIVVVVVLRTILASLIRRLFRTTMDAVPPAYLVSSVAQSIALVVVTQIDGSALNYLELSAKAAAKSGMVLDTAAIVFVTIAVYQFVQLICARIVSHVMRHKEHGRDIAVTITPLIASTIKFFVAILGAAFALGTLGVNIAAIITGLSIGGAALALASQDTVKNIFGSLVILTERPFVVGDWISTQGIEGTVEVIGFRSTRVRTFSDTVMYVSNAKLADSLIENMDMRQVRRFKTTVYVDIAAGPETIERFIEDARKTIGDDPNTVLTSKKLLINVSAITQQGVAMTVISWFSVNESNPEPIVLHRLNMILLTAMRAHGLLIRGDYEPVSDQTGIHT